MTARMTDTTMRRPGLLRRIRIPVLIYVIVLGSYLGASGSRLKKHSNDNHYVYLASNIVEGRLSLRGAPPHQNDWALVEELTLTDGREVRGHFLRTGGPNRFKTTRGERLTIPPERIRSRKHVYYVSFPWFPALLMLPFVAIWGLSFNDVLFTVIIAAVNPVLVYLLLRRLAAFGYSTRTVVTDLWLVAMFAFGTVYFYSSVLGQVWYTAHVVGVGLTAIYAMAAIEGRHPMIAGACLGLGFVTRPPIAFSFPLILGEVLRKHLAPDGPPADPSGVSTAGSGGEQPPSLWARIRAVWPRVRLRPAFRDMIWCGIPVLIVGGVAMTLNTLRFDNPFEFGHSYLNVRWTERIQRWGLFNYHFVSRNLAVMLCLLPRILTRPPYVQISWHGLSLLFTTPLFAYVLWPRRRSPLMTWLYLSCLLPMITHLMYQNSGWVQFGYRFSLDYTVYLVALLALGGRRIGWLARGLIVFGVGVNTFGAITFSRMGTFYWPGMFPVK